MADQPYNPNDPTSFTGGPEFQKPSIEQLSTEDIFNIKQIEKDMSSVFSKLFKKAAKTYAKEMGRASGEVKKLQDKYYDFITTKERKHYDAVLKQQKDIIKQLEAERKKTETKLNTALENQELEKAETLKKKRLEIADKIKKAELANSKEIKNARLKAEASEGGVRGLTAKARLGGGKLSGAIKGAKLFYGVLATLATVFLKVSHEAKEFTKTQAKLRSAGSGLKGTYSEATRFFDLVGGMRAKFGITADDARGFISTLAEAPKALKRLETEEGVDDLRMLEGIMGDVGATIPDTMKLVAEAQRQQNLSTKDLIDTYKTARSISDSTNLTFQESFKTMLNMNKQLRNLTFNTSEASKLFVSLMKPLEKIGMSQDEIKEFGTSIAQALGNLSPEKYMGLFSFVKGRMPTLGEFTDLEKGGQTDMIIQAYRKILSPGEIFATGRGSEATAAKVVGFGQQFNLPTGNRTQATALIKFLQGEMTRNELDKAMKDAQVNLEEAMRRGNETLSNMVTPLDKLKTGLDNAVTSISQGLVPAIKAANQKIDQLIGILSFKGVRNNVGKTGDVLSSPLDHLGTFGKMLFSPAGGATSTEEMENIIIRNKIRAVLEHAGKQKSRKEE